MAQDLMNVKDARLRLVSQADLRKVQYHLGQWADREDDPEVKAAFRNVENAIWDITNHYGFDGIASRELMQEYFGGEDAKKPD